MDILLTAISFCFETHCWRARRAQQNLLWRVWKRVPCWSVYPHNFSWRKAFVCTLYQSPIKCCHCHGLALHFDFPAALNANCRAHAKQCLSCHSHHHTQFLWQHDLEITLKALFSVPINCFLFIVVVLSIDKNINQLAQQQVVTSGPLWNTVTALRKVIHNRHWTSTGFATQRIACLKGSLLQQNSTIRHIGCCK